MPKIVPSGRVGIPVPNPAVADAVALVVYYGSHGFTPDYSQAARLELPLAQVPTQDVNGTPFYVFDTALLPALPEGDYDLAFTLKDDVGNEGDFSPALDIPFDRDPPATLGQPVVVS
jgi:hypothetical protein